MENFGCRKCRGESFDRVVALLIISELIKKAITPTPIPLFLAKSCWKNENHSIFNLTRKKCVKHDIIAYKNNILKRR